MRNHTVTLRDTAGNSVSGASITVYTQNTTTKAILYSDNGITPITNPVTTNSKGQANFYVADGIYDLYVSGTNLTSYTLEDISIYEPVGVTATQTLTNKTLTSPVLTTPNLTFASISKTTTYTATAADFLIHCDATAGAFTLTLPPAASHSGRIFVIGKSDSSANAVLVDGNSSETIDGVLSIYLYLQYDYITIQSDGTNWKMLAKTWQEDIIRWTITGNLSATANAAPSWPFTHFAGRIFGAYAYVRTAPATQSILIDINKNGTTIWTTQANRLTIAATTNKAVQAAFDTVLLNQDDRLDLDVDQVGTGTVGADATILLNVRIQSRLLS